MDDDNSFFEVTLLDTKRQRLGVALCLPTDSTFRVLVKCCGGLDPADPLARAAENGKLVLEVEESAVVVAVSRETLLGRDCGVWGTKLGQCSVCMLLTVVADRELWMKGVAWLGVAALRADSAVVTSPPLPPIIAVTDVLHHLSSFLTLRSIASIAASCRTAYLALFQNERPDLPWQLMSLTPISAAQCFLVGWSRPSAAELRQGVWRPLAFPVLGIGYVPGPVRLREHLRVIRANALLHDIIQPFIREKYCASVASDTELVRYPVAPVVDDIHMMQKGQLVDVLDTVKKWYDAVIIDRNEQAGTVTVHFRNWGNMWDEVIPVGSARLAPYGTHSAASVPTIRQFMNCEIRFFAFDAVEESDVDARWRSSIAMWLPQCLRSLFSYVIPDGCEPSIAVNVPKEFTAVLNKSLALAETRIVDSAAVNRIFAFPLSFSAPDEMQRFRTEYAFCEAVWEPKEVRIPVCASEARVVQERVSASDRLIQRRIDPEVVASCTRVPIEQIASSAPVNVFRAYVFMRPRLGFGMVVLRYGAYSWNYNHTRH